MPLSSDLDLWIDTLIARSDELRKRGVLSIAIGDMSATLAPAEPDLPGNGDAPTLAPEPFDPLHDAASYLHGIVPGFEIFPLGEEPGR